jgi:hypothetical protein
MSRADTYFADTTIVYYRLHSHVLLKQAVQEAVGQGKLAVSNFVRGEYIRGFVIGLIDLYSTIKEENAVEPGIQVFVARMGGHPRKLSHALQSIAHWLCGLEEWQDVGKTLRRLGEYIRGRVYEFDITFVTRARDPLNCELGILSFPQDTYQENQVFDFRKEFEDVRSGPTCDQCEFRQDQQQELNADGVDLHSPNQQRAHAHYKGYVQQAKWVDKALRSRLTTPSCWYCEKLADTIIALSAPVQTTLLTGDKQSFPPLTSILRKPLQLVPSLEELRRRRDGK